MGAIADLMIQPYGAFFMGSLCGIVSTLGYRLLQVSDNATIILIPFLDIYFFVFHIIYFSLTLLYSKCSREGYLIGLGCMILAE